jgi:hypothetical protein
LANKEITSNIKKSNNRNIINKVNPKIILDFYEEVPLNNELFSAVNKNKNILNFDLKYAKKFETVG